MHRGARRSVSGAKMKRTLDTPEAEAKFNTGSLLALCERNDLLLLGFHHATWLL